MANISHSSGVDNKAIRRALARLLQAEAGGPTKFAARIGKSPSQVSQVIGTRDDGDDSKLRGIGDDLARDIEAGMGKPAGWLDQAQNLRPPATMPDVDYQSRLEMLQEANKRLSRQIDILALALERILERAPSEQHDEGEDLGHPPTSPHRGRKPRRKGGARKDA